MRLILDNIIFQLQVSGGISNYWYQLIKYLNHKELDLAIFENEPSENIFQKLVDLKPYEQLGHQAVPLGRYINPTLKNETKQALFHSSYYRTSLNKNHINITTVHDFTYERFIKGPKSLAHKLQKKRAIINSPGIICISENTKNDLLKYVPEAVNNNITVIPHGVSSQAFKVLENHTNPPSFKEPFPFAPKTYLIYVGDRKASYKNFEKAVDTAKETKLPLVIIGGGPLKPHETEKLNHSLPKFNYKHFTRVSNEALNWFYNNAYALLYPSSYEGFGLPVIEAQMAGCPVVALNASSIPEVAGNAAILVDRDETAAFVEAVNQLNTSPLREKLIKKGLQNASKFTWQNTFDLTFSFYKKMFNEQ